LIVAACRESGLPRARLEGERGRTMGQLRLFAAWCAPGHGSNCASIRLCPNAPLPRPDLRLRMIPVGPVAVFGASNFPLAFSTAGGDTASALAAGCPVVVKGHPAHPETGALVASAIARAVAACGLPSGVFGHLVGPSNELGAALVRIRASRRWALPVARWRSGAGQSGGIAPCADPGLCRNEQHQPRPADARSAESARRGAGHGFVGSLTMGAGQFCTNPGLLLAIEGEGLDAFIATATGGVAQAPAQVMLTKGIGAAYRDGTAALAGADGVEQLAAGEPGEGTACGAILFQTTAAAFLANPALAHEVFGASSILVRCADEAELTSVLKGLEGQLTATLHMDDGDADLAGRVLPVLERKVGRILANGWPTGVEVCHAMVHGGPFPATSDPRTTSVGSLAIDRFLRPVSYQNLAPALLPAELRDEHAAMARRV
jgi:NADP-dependent aldehyde dehydrogenase